MKRPQTSAQQQISLDNFRYNRFLLLRYLLAIFFFIDLYWGLALLLSRNIFLLLPLGFICFSIPAIAEHLRLYGQQTNEVKGKLTWNQRYQRLHLGVNVILGLFCLSDSSFKYLFPFFKTTASSKGFVIFMLLLGIFLSIISLKRIAMIYQNEDRYTQYIAVFEHESKKVRE